MQNDVHSSWTKVDKDRAIALIRENIIRRMLLVWNALVQVQV